MVTAMIVESLGTSGSGKSTLIPILTRLLRDEGWQAMSITEAIHFYMSQTWVGRLVSFVSPPSLRGPILWRIFCYAFSNWHFFGFAMRYPRLMCHVVRGQLRRPLPWSHRWLILRLYFEMTGRAQFFKHHVQPGQVIFLDEGFVHRATHLFVSEAEITNPDQVIAYLQLLPPPDLVMWVRVPLDLCLSRIYARGVQVRLAHLSTSEAQEFLLKTEQVCQIVAGYLKNAGRLVIEVENIDGPEVCATQLCQAVMQHLV